MGALPNQRQEIYAQLLKRGTPAYKAYPQAGYKFHESNCYRLSGNERIKRRVNELTRHIAVKTRVTIVSLTEQIVEDREFAREHDNPSAAHAATISLGKLHGLMVDRKEVGQPGDYAALQSVEAVREKLVADHGEEIAALLDAALARSEAQREVIEVEASKPIDAAERSVGLFRS